jgi:hypothetical protein
LRLARLGAHGCQPTADQKNRREESRSAEVSR